MKHFECANFLHLDCEKGMCAKYKMMVPMDGTDSDACSMFEEGFMCRFCKHFTPTDKYGIGICNGFEKENWAYAQCGAFSCEKFKRK